MARKRIGFDGGCLASKRGFGRFARWCLRALAEADSAYEFVVFLDEPSRDQVTLPTGSNLRMVIVPLKQAPSQAASAKGNRRLGDILAMSRAVARERLDLLFFPASYSFFPVWNAGKVVVAMHDTLALDFPHLVFPTKRGHWFWKLKERLAVKFAHRIVTVSEASKRDLKRWFSLTDEQIRVVPEGPETCFRRLASWDPTILGRFGVDPNRRFALYVGGLSPHKNLSRLIQAFGTSAPQDAVLVLVGDHGDVFHTHVPELRSLIQTEKLVDRVVLPGYVPDEDLVHFYHQATFLIQPSLMEGFGLPPVEAMACGTPVASSRAGSLPEVVGDAGIYFDPTNLEEMGESIRCLFEDTRLRSELADKALIRAQQFRRENTAQALLGCFDELLGQGGLAP